MQSLSNDAEDFGNDRLRREAPSYITIIAICIVIATIDAFTTADRFADYDTYVLYLDQLIHFPPDNWLIIEPGSNLYLLSIYEIYQEIETSISVAHFLLGAIFVAFLYRSNAAWKSNWQSIALVFALLGPLLAFVTLRATPSYFLVAIAVNMAAERKKTFLFPLTVAFLFHVSTVLAVIPISILFLYEASPKFLRLERPIPIMFGSAAFIGLIYIFLPQISSSAFNVLSAIPALSKYTSYTIDGASANQITSSNHYVFFGFVTIFLTSFFFLSEEKKYNAFALSSYALYCLLFFSASPVAAFRQTPFWVIPLIGQFPWQKFRSAPINLLFLFSCGAIFYFQFMQVYQ